MDGLVVIDGLDGSGKATQTDLLFAWYKQQNIPVKQISFPNYESRSSALIQMYLNGEITKDPAGVNAYAAASFYAADRYISYITDWKANYKQNELILCDRYVTSNAIHQMVKLKKEEWNDFLVWLDDYEYQKLGLPKPNKVIYLDIDTEVSQKLLDERYKQNGLKKDIHEADIDYLRRCREAGLYVARLQKWKVISCCHLQKLRTVDDIFTEITEYLEG